MINPIFFKEPLITWQRRPRDKLRKSTKKSCCATVRCTMAPCRR